MSIPLPARPFPGCTEEAQWLIYLSDEYRLSCTRHVGDQLTPGAPHCVEPAAANPLLFIQPDPEELMERLREQFAALSLPLPR